MEKNTYIILYDIDDDTIIKERLKALWTWMNYFPKSLIFESELSAKEIYKQVSIGYEKNRILINQLDKINYWWVMPQWAWDWIKKRKPHTLLQSKKLERN